MNKQNKKRIGIVFGVFDGLHEGHRYLLSEAAKRADELVVVLTLPETTLLLKGRLPRHSYDDRAKAIISFNPHTIVIPADKMPGTWSVFHNYPSCTVILGYDQQSIAHELEKMKIPFIFAAPHHPEKYKSSLLSND